MTTLVGVALRGWPGHIRDLSNLGVSFLSFFLKVKANIVLYTCTLNTGADSEIVGGDDGNLGPNPQGPRAH